MSVDETQAASGSAGGEAPPIEDTHRKGWSLFCDDVRAEVTGKQILIGVYGTHLFVQKFPHEMSRLVVFTRLMGDAGDPLKSLALKIYRDAAVIAELRLENVADIKDPGPLPFDREQVIFPPGESDARRFSFGGVVEIGRKELLFERPTSLWVRFNTERGFVRAGSLRVVAAPPELKVGPHSPDAADPAPPSVGT